MNIFSLECEKAKEFLLKHESYFDAHLPLYLSTQSLFENLAEVKDFNIDYRDIDVSEKLHVYLYQIKANGTPRPLTLINPVLYYDFICHLTNDEHWNNIKRAFKFYENQNDIYCSSLPIVMGKHFRKKANQILNWWIRFEQQSIKFNLIYSKQYHIDIESFYPSINLSTLKRAFESLDIQSFYPICENIFNTFQEQGVPQGSAAFHILAELFLLNIDKQLVEVLKKLDIEDYRILRYRDDYRIFANDDKVINLIKNQLESLLNSHGVYLNNNKSYLSNDIIFDSVKIAKHDWFLYENTLKMNNNFQQNLLILYRYGNQHPNGTGIVRGLNHIRQKYQNKEFDNSGRYLENMSIVLNIIAKNQNYCAQGFALLSDMIERIKDDESKKIYLKIIHSFFMNKKMSCQVEIWLQRFIFGFDLDTEYQWKNILCKTVLEENNYSQIWDMEWIKSESLKKVIDNQSFTVPTTLSTKFADKEVNLFAKPDKEDFKALLKKYLK